MDATHVHLLINHLPVIGTFFGALVLLYGILTKSVHTKNAAYFILIIAAIGGGVAYLTGEGAEEVAEKLPGVSKDFIHEHEEAAEKALVGIIILGVASLVGLFLNQRKTAAPVIAWVVLLFATITFAVGAYTAYIGGSIRHTEIRNTAGELKQTVEGEDE